LVLVFSSNNYIWTPDPRVRAVSNIDSNLPRFSNTVFCDQRCQKHRWPLVAGVNNTADQ
jgi:hypothetical protein